MTMICQAAPKVPNVTAKDVTTSDIVAVVKQAKDGTFEVEEVLRGNTEFLRPFLGLLSRLRIESSRDRRFLYLNREGRDPLDPLKANRLPEIVGKKYIPIQGAKGNFLWLAWRDALNQLQ